VSVDYVIAGGTATAPPGADADFAGPLTGTLTFAPGQTSRTLTIPLVNDAIVEPDETLTVTLQNPQGGATLGAPAVATVTIVDTDRVGTVQFSAPNSTVAENVAGGLATITVTRTGSTTAAATVDVTVSDGSAHAPDDYTGAGTATLAFAP